MILFRLSYTNFLIWPLLKGWAEILKKKSLVFWEIWRQQKDISKLTDLSQKPKLVKHWKLSAKQRQLDNSADLWQNIWNIALFGFFRSAVLPKMVRYITVFSSLYIMLFCTKKTSTMDGCGHSHMAMWRCGTTCMYVILHFSKL